MSTILGLDIVVLSLIVAISGTAIYQLRTYNDKPLKKIIDGSIVTFSGALFVVYGGYSLIVDSSQDLQLMVTIGAISSIAATGFVGKKIFGIIRPIIPTGQITTTKPDGTIITTMVPASSSKEAVNEILEKSKQGKKIEQNMLPPQLGPDGEWYQTNFTKDSKKGNVLPYGEKSLWIRIQGVKSYATAVLKDSQGRWLQIDQSHSFDEDNDIETTRIELYNKIGEPFPKGKYFLESRGDRGTSDSTGIKSDEFWIV
jgi:hypothetical protein